MLFAKRQHLKIALVVLVLAATPQSTIQADTLSDMSSDALFDLSIDEIMNLEIALTARNEENLFQSAAAATVITAEDIRRSSADSIPELLRMVPGLNVARVNSHYWAISARGGQEVYANKLLVMIDNRSIYSGLFGGVFWDMEHLVMEDIERIEIIRGPGGALWGANAVNGIINIVTKKATDTQGLLLVGATGKQRKGDATVRYGMPVNDHTHARAFARSFSVDNSIELDGRVGIDDYRVTHGGFRLDSMPTEADEWTIMGGAYAGDLGDSYTGLLADNSRFNNRERYNMDIDGGHLIGHWTHRWDNDAELALNMYYDQSHRVSPTVNYKPRTYDVDLQHRFNANENHQLTWGLEYRLISDESIPTYSYGLNPADYDLHLYATFIQDRWTLIEDRLFFIYGSKFEHNSFTGFEYQPNIRLTWTPDERQTVWAAVSRAVSTPTRHDNHSKTRVAYIAFLSSVVSFEGSPAVTSEELLAYELGYRVQPHADWILDIATYFNVYDDLVTYESRPITGDRRRMVDNKSDGESYGIELSANYQAKPWWRWHGGYTFSRELLHNDPDSSDTGEVADERTSPRHYCFLRSLINLPKRFEFDTMLRYQDSAFGISVPKYIELEARLGWHITDHTELSFVGQNLLNSDHVEFRHTGNISSCQAGRAYFVKLVHYIP